MTTNELEAQMSTDDRERVVRLSWLVLKTCASRFFGSWGFYDLNDFATVCLHAVQLPVETFNPRPVCTSSSAQINWQIQKIVRALATPFL